MERRAVALPRITPEDIRRMSIEELRAAAAKRLEELCGPLTPEERQERQARVDKMVAEELEELAGRKRGGGGKRR